MNIKYFEDNIAGNSSTAMITTLTINVVI